MGNGRATVLRFAEEGAKVMAVDRDIASAEETVAMVKQRGGQCVAFEADVTKEATLGAAVAAAHKSWGRIDILHYNVGVSIAGGDAPLLDFTEDAFDRISAINLRGAIRPASTSSPSCDSSARHNHHDLFACRLGELPSVAYKATKAAMIAFTQQVAIQNAEYGIRANVILPGLMDTPMAVDTRARRAARAAPRSRQSATPACRCGARWAPRGTWPMRHCSSPPTRPISSPA